jgi:hypothetical protein
MTASAAPGTHAPHNMKHFTLVRSAIDEISGKKYLTIRVTKGAIISAIVRFSQQPAQRVRMTRDIGMTWQFRVLINYRHFGCDSSSKRCLA